MYDVCAIHTGRYSTVVCSDPAGKDLTRYRKSHIFSLQYIVLYLNWFWEKADHNPQKIGSITGTMGYITSIFYTTASFSISWKDEGPDSIRLSVKLHSRCFDGVGGVTALWADTSVSGGTTCHKPTPLWSLLRLKFKTALESVSSIHVRNNDSNVKPLMLGWYTFPC